MVEGKVGHEINLWVCRDALSVKFGVGRTSMCAIAITNMFTNGCLGSEVKHTCEGGTSQLSGLLTSTL